MTPITDMPNELDPRGSMLFLGSGFSKSARNILGENLPTGHELRLHFANILEVDAANYDLKTLADEIDSRPDVNLYQMLYRMFTVQELNDIQTDILSHPWHRIYTTNYDDSIEFARSRNGQTPSSFSYTDKKPKKLPTGSVVHLHGTIRDTKEHNVLDQLILNENSYVRQHFEKSHWYQDFDRTLRFCSACFFVGYSLSDYHISAILMQNPGTRHKVFFVTTRKPDTIFCNRVAPYGRVIPIGVDGFAEKCTSLPVVQTLVSPHSTKSFQYLDPLKDRKTVSAPTAIEVFNLVTYGHFNYQRCLETLPDGEYVAPRQEKAKEAALLLRDARCLLVHSRIGNGKSIFLYILSHLLSQQGYRCFLSQDNEEFLSADLEILKSTARSAIFFDSYDTAVDLIDLLAELPQEAIFIVSVRTGVQEVRLHEIQLKLPTPLERIDLNGIHRADIIDLQRLLDRSGLGNSDLPRLIRRSKDFRDVILTLYKNEYVKSKIDNEIIPLLDDVEFKKVFVVSHLLSWTGHSWDPAFIRGVVGCDPYAAIIRFRETAGDIFALDDGHLQVRSSVFSEYLIQNHMTN